MTASPRTPDRRGIPVRDASRWPQGVFRRRVRITNDPVRGVIEGGLEDDFHHFEVRIAYDDTRVVEAAGGARRFPWSTCPEAADQIGALAGALLTDRSSAVGRHTDARLQCTHTFDLASLCVAHAARRDASRTYDVAVTDRIDDRSEAEITCNGALLLRWSVLADTITEPEPFAGVSLRLRFLQWTEQLDPVTADAAAILRRTTMIAAGRAMDLDDVDVAAQTNAPGTCYTAQVGRIDTARRIRGSTLDFADHSDRLLS